MSKLVRGPRLALDAMAAAALARACPALTTVHVSLLVDEAAGGLSALWTRRWGSRSPSRSPSRLPRRQGSGTSATVAATRHQQMVTGGRRLADRYGLAYMAAKSIVGPSLVLALYAVMQLGGGMQQPLIRRSSEALGRLLVGPLPTAATSSVIPLPGAGQMAGMVALATNIGSLCFPLTALLAARLTIWVVAQRDRSVAPTASADRT